MDELDPAVKANLVAALESTRAITPPFNNWLLFSATVEAALAALGAPWDRMRVDYALRQHEQWYKGDGLYGDGPTFHWDYYNSFVIHPMLVDVLTVCADEMPAWKEMDARVRERARAVRRDPGTADLSRGHVPRDRPIARVPLRRLSPAGAVGAAPRPARGASAGTGPGALTAVILATMEAPGTFDDGGWLRIGFCGHQPEIGEAYISTGSLYLCSVACSARPAGLRRILVGRGGAVDSEARVERSGLSDRSRHRRVTIRSLRTG